MVWLNRNHHHRNNRRPAYLLTVSFVAVILMAACGDDDSPGGIPAADCPAGVSYFQRAIYDPILSKQCVVCHTSEGMARESKMILVPASDPNHMMKNFDVLRKMALLDEDNKPVLLVKPTGEHSAGHTGGIVVPRDSASYASLQRFVTAVRDQTECDGSASLCTGSRAGRRRLRRLTRVEYDRTVQDLLGTTSSYGASFSADAVVDGFDNNADERRRGKDLRPNLHEGLWSTGLSTTRRNRRGRTLLCPV